MIIMIFVKIDDFIVIFLNYEQNNEMSFSM